MSNSTKLNKTQTVALMSQVLSNTVIDHLDLIKGSSTANADKLIAALTSALALAVGPQTGSHTSNKIDAEGNIYCNYFKAYMAPERFNTKLTKANKTTGDRHEAPKANCVLAEQILRKIKVLKRNVEMQATENMRSKTISIEEFDSILDSLDQAINTHYETVEAVPTVADVVGLTAAMADLA